MTGASLRTVFFANRVFVKIGYRIDPREEVVRSGRDGACEDEEAAIPVHPDFCGNGGITYEGWLQFLYRCIIAYAHPGFRKRTEMLYSTSTVKFTTSPSVFSLLCTRLSHRTRIGRPLSRRVSCLASGIPSSSSQQRRSFLIAAVRISERVRISPASSSGKAVMPFR